MYERLVTQELGEGKRSLLLLGPRQVGKSTLLRSLKPDTVLNLADPELFRSFVARPERLRAELAALPESARLVFIDEVQRVPAILDLIQVLLDEQPNRWRFLLSGSSARKLRRGQANLLPGRIHVRYLHPLLVSELGDDYDIQRAMAHGTLPGIYSESDPAERARSLRSYVDTYLREEVQAEALVRDLGGYARLLDLVAASSGHILNLRALGQDAAIGYETSRRYLQILEDTLLLIRIPAWSGSDRGRLIQHPRLLLFDAGVRNALLGRPLDKVLPDDRGLLLEHLVGLELHRHLDTSWPGARLYHYRTSDGAEVDYVLDLGQELWAIEVKASSDIRSPYHPGFASLAERSDKVTRRIIVCMTPRAQRAEGVEILPVEEFLRSLGR